MADLIVTNNSDSGAGSLRQAILDANANWILNPGDGSTITFAAGVANQTVTLSTALPAIAGDLSISGAAFDIDGNPSSQNITVSGGNLVRVFFVTSGDVSFSYLKIANGNATGGAGTDGGGGGLGAGAAIFVEAGTTSVTNIDFLNNIANGGVGGAGTSTGGAGGNGPDGTGGGTADGGSGGFGGGGGADLLGTGGNGGFGGGGGGSGGVGGVGGGQAGIGVTAGGGGGAAFGGAIFIQDGASLTLGSGTFSTSAVTHGSGAAVGGTDGAELGSDLFLMSSATGHYTFAPVLGQTLSFNGTIADDSLAALPAGSYTAGNGAGAQVSITGEGTVVYTLGHDYSYAGTTTVSNGILRVNGTVSHSLITVNGTGTLDGTGTVGSVSVFDSGKLAPGSNGVGTLHTGNVTFVDLNDPPAAPGSFSIELASGGQDKLQVIGTVNLTDAHLTGSLLGGFNPSNGTSFTIIDNDGSDPIVGTFAGVDEGAAVNIGGRAFSVTYVGGTNSNDVVITAVANGAPGLTGFGPSSTFLESAIHATPQIIDSSVVFDDVEGNFNGGTLTLTGLVATDTVNINSTGFDPGQIFFDAGVVYYEGIPVGTAAGGSGTTFTVNFNGNATAAAIDRLIENLTYQNSSDTPPTSHQLTLNVTDSGAATTGDKLITINITLDGPVITSNDGGDLASVLVPENSTAVTTVVAADPNGPSIAYSIVGGADQGKFQIDSATGVLSFITAPNFEAPTDADANNSYIVQVRASDGSLTDTQTITVVVADRADPFQWAGSPDLGSHGVGWQVGGVGDFNHDGTSDVLWRNTTTGQVDEWQLANGQWAHSVDLGTHDPAYQVAGIGDFDGDGTSDVLWRNPSTGQLETWIMANGQWSRSVDLGGHGTDWQVLGVGDFNNDHTSDILFRNTTTGQVDEWRMADGNWSQSISLGSFNTAWQFAGIGDFDGDGNSDVLWRNPTTGQVNEWRLLGGQWANSVDLGTFNPAFQVAAVNDFNGDGTSDVLWRNPTTGQMEGWVMQNSQWAGSVSLGSFDPAYRVAGTGDFDHTLTADVLWHNPTTGQVNEWLFTHL
jgi:hypothetical protein